MVAVSDNEAGIHGQRVRRGKGNESIRREALQDPRLSFKATGMLGFLLSLPGNWRTNAERLSKAKNSQGKAREGREAMQSGLRELEEAGYLLRRKYQDERGTWRWIWRYSDDPSDLHESDVSAGQTVNGLAGYGSAVDDSPVDIEVLQKIAEPKGSDDDAAASRPGPQCSPNEGGQEQSAAEDHGTDLFASWQGLNQDHREEQDRRINPGKAASRNGHGTHRGSGAKVTRTKRSSSRAALPPDQAAAVSQSVGRWVDSYRAAHADVEPSGQRRGQAAREIRALIVAGNDPGRVLAAAESAGRAGFATVEQQLVRMTSTNGGGRPGRVSATELPRDDWRRFVQE